MDDSSEHSQDHKLFKPRSSPGSAREEWRKPGESRHPSEPLSSVKAGWVAVRTEEGEKHPA